MKKLHFVWFVVLIVIILATLSQRRESARFYGVAETREIVVNRENAVEI